MYVGQSTGRSVRQPLNCSHHRYLAPPPPLPPPPTPITVDTYLIYYGVLSKHPPGFDVVVVVVAIVFFVALLKTAEPQKGERMVSGRPQILIFCVARSLLSIRQHAQNS